MTIQASMKVKNVEKISSNKNTIFKECVQCKQIYVARYWDEELDWYIDLNHPAYCHHSQEKNSSA